MNLLYLVPLVFFAVSGLSNACMDIESISRPAKTNPPLVCPPPVLPPPAKVLDTPLPTLYEDMNTLLDYGRTTKTAEPGFLSLMEAILARHAGDDAAPPSSTLPFNEAFRGTTMPKGWAAIQPVWRFNPGEATQTRSAPNQRFFLYYLPGRSWRNYSFIADGHSKDWFTPPMRSTIRFYFRCRDVDNAYCLDLISTDEIILYIRENGQERELHPPVTGTGRVRNGKPWQITVYNDLIFVFQDGELILQVADSTFPEGTVGLESIHMPATFGPLDVLPL